MRRGKPTACATPGIPDPHALNDKHAEMMVLKGLMFDPAETYIQLGLIDFTAGDFFYDVNQKLYDVLCYLIVGGQGGPMLVEVFEEVKRRRDRGGYLGGNFGKSSEAAIFLIDVWETDMWLTGHLDDPTPGQPHMVGMFRWGEVRNPENLHFYAWAATAAANKLHHLTARRQAVYAANELIRDALSPTGGADYIDGRIQRLNEGDY